MKSNKTPAHCSQERYFVVLGCNEELCPFCSEREVPDWGTEIKCNYPEGYQFNHPLGMEYELNCGKGRFPEICPLRSHPAPSQAASPALATIEEIWKFCLINGAEEHGDLIGAPSDPFFTLKLLKHIAEIREALQREQAQQENSSRKEG